MSAFSELLYTMREQKDLTQKQVATKAACDKSLISRFESANRHPTSRRMVIELANAMDCDGDETDQLLIAADFAPVQVSSLLYCKALGRLDEWLAYSGNDAVKHDAEVMVDKLIGTPVNDEAMSAAAV